MVFKRILASVGIGNAQVDTVLQTSVCKPGEILHGMIYLRGGSVDQTLDSIDLILETVALREQDEMQISETCSILRHRLQGHTVLFATAMREIPFAIRIPYETPLTRIFNLDLGIPLYLRTEIDIAGAVNPSDRDRLEVEPHNAQQRILQAMNNLSLSLYKADVEWGHIQGSGLPFYQELEFTAGPRLSHRIKEVELSFVGREKEMDVIFEIDRRSQGWGRQAYRDSDLVRGFTMPYNAIESQNWEQIIENLLLR